MSRVVEDKARLQQVVADLLKEAASKGASAAEAAASMDAGLSCSVRLGELETVEHSRDNTLWVTVYFGQRKGSASTSDFNPASVRETVEAACRIARHTQEDDCAGLADAGLMASDPPELDLYHPWALDVDQAARIAKACESAAMGFDPRIDNSEGATLNSHAGLHIYGNSHGFIGGYPSSSHDLSCAVVAREGDGMQRDYWYTRGCAADQLEAAEAVGVKAAERTVARLGGRKLSTRECPILFQAEMAIGLLRSFVGAIRGGSQYRQSSFLLDRNGSQVFPAFVNIHETPHLLRSLGSAPFDSEGVATRARDWVSDGVLQGYVLDSYSARKLGMQTTGNAGGVHNLQIQAGDADRQALLKQMGTGLLVTELMGHGVNQVTGDYSRGAAGFWVEDGEIAYPVEEITVAGNLKDMYLGLQAVGSDVDARGNYRTGSWLIDRMTVAGD